MFDIFLFFNFFLFDQNVGLDQVPDLFPSACNGVNDTRYTEIRYSQADMSKGIL
jgi:hypothetical protein